MNNSPYTQAQKQSDVTILAKIGRSVPSVAYKQKDIFDNHNYYGER